MLNKPLLLLFCLSFFCQLKAQEVLDAQQRAWLYRVVEKTPVLSANASACIKFEKTSFYLLQNGQYVFQWETAERFMISHPDSLKIDFVCLSHLPNGLLGEISVKLALYELVFHLKTPRSDGEIIDTFSQILSRDIIKVLPDGLSNRPQTKRARAVVDVLMNPSLPVIRKVKDMTQLGVLPEEQEVLMKKWVQIVTAWANDRGTTYYQLFSCDDNMLNINVLRMVAAGDGSGTAGLLNEQEINPIDSTETGYGRGTGLFTYKYSIRESVLKTQLQSDETIELPANAHNAIHCSLWGLDSRLKPLIVITCNDKSYHLFSIDETGYLTPDEKAGEGISYMERLKQMVEQRINKPLAKMSSTEGLGTILENEMALKSKIEEQLHLIEKEVDSLKKLPDVNQVAINSRLSQINTCLSNLSIKERRIQDLGRKITAQANKVDNSRKVIDEMQRLLGPNPQKWKREGTLFTFDDGVQFNMITQDLIFPPSIRPQKAKVGLVSASMTLSGDLRDEVQVFVNLTHPKVFESKAVVAVTTSSENWMLYYVPDAYRPYQSIDSMIHWFRNITKATGCGTRMTVKLTYSEAALKGDKYQDVRREQQMPITELGKKRYAIVNARMDNNTLMIDIEASTDGVATRLSGLAPELRQKLGVSRSSVANNKLLALLRGYWLANQIAIKSNGKVEVVKPANITNEEWQLIQEVIK